MMWKWFRNFLLVNLCAVVPLCWVGIGWMPTQVKVEVRGAAPAVLVAGETVLLGEEHGSWKGGGVWRFYLREGMAWKDLTFRLPKGMDGGDVGWVKLEKWKLLSLKRRGTGLERKTGDENDFVFQNPSFERVGLVIGKISLVLAGMELALLCLSWWCAKRHHEERWRTLLPSALGVSLVLTVLMQVALPVQSWLANQSAYPFSAGNLALAVAWRAVWVFALSAAALGVLGRCFGRWVLGATLAFAVCVYLESGILAEGLPELNGEWGFFQNNPRGLWDMAVWCAVFALTAVGHSFLKKWYGVVSFCLLVLVSASMLDTKRKDVADTSRFIVHEFCSIGEVARSVEYSPTKNVLVFIVDSLEREQAHAIMDDPEAGPRLREQFRGFTEYTNTVGACDYSLPAVANLMTGKYPEYREGRMSASYYASVYSEESALKDYLDARYAIYVGTEALGYGFTNRKRSGFGAGKKAGAIWNIPPEGEQDFSLAEICRFRWLPFAAKVSYGKLRGLGRAERKSMLQEDVLYPILAQGTVRTAATSTFLLEHTDGVHIPILRGRNGESLPQENNTNEGVIALGIYVMGQLGELMDSLRQKDIYDSSLIVVLADHGHHGFHWESKEKGLPGRAKPFLWIKCPASAHEFRSDGTPTSHSRIAVLLREACCRNVSEEDCRQILRSENRLFRRDTGSRWEDYHVDRVGNYSVSTIEKTASPISLKTSLHTGVEYVLHIAEMAKHLDVEIQFGDALKLVNGEYPIWWPDTPHMDLKFQVPDGRLRYTVRLGVRVWNSAETGENQAGSQALLWCGGTERTSLSDVNRGEVVFRGVLPDNQGLVCIEGEREDGFRSKVQLTHLRIDTEK